MNWTPENQVLLSASFDSFEQLATMARAWDIDFRQLGPSTAGHRLLQVSMGGLLMSRVRFSCHVDQHGDTPRGLRTFALLEESCPPVFWFGRRVGPSDLLIFPEHGDIDAVSRPGFYNHTVAIPTDALADFFADAGGPDLAAVLGPQDTVIRLTDRQLLLLRTHLRLISFDEQVLQRSLATLDAYRDRLFSLLFDILGGNVNVARTREDRRRVIRSVTALLAQRREEPCDVAELSGLLKVPVRTLSATFRRELGMSPGAFVKGSRLYGAHRDLWHGQAGRVRVVDVANAWGFWHMGQFAADYRRLFGELPRATLARPPSADA